jgi:hypothetical protein
VVQAANWLVKNDSLYKDEGITFNESWLEKFSTDNIVSDVNETNNTADVIIEDDDNWNELHSINY